MPKIISDDGAKIIAPGIAIVEMTADHIFHIKDKLREEDAAEIMAFGITVSRGMWYGYKHSLIKKTAIIDGHPVAVWGCYGDLLANVGSPWLKATPEVNVISPLKFARIFQEEVLSMLKLFSRLENYVHSEYTSAIRLLEIIGFNVHEPESKGLLGSLYRKYELGE